MLGQGPGARGMGPCQPYRLRGPGLASWILVQGSHVCGPGVISLKFYICVIIHKHKYENMDVRWCYMGGVPVCTC